MRFSALVHSLRAVLAPLGRALASLSLALGVAVPVAGASEVSVRGADILVDGAPFVPNGAAGLSRFGELKATGANTLRTYGEEPGELLDAAQRAGLKVIVGFWMGHPRLGFDYGNRAAVEAQLADLRRMVERYRTHPALLMWAVGNEIEVDLTEEQAMPLWPAVEEAARLVKSLDSHHPVMAVLAETGAGKVAAIKRLVPSVDVLGLNGYGDGLLTTAKRARVQGWTGPILLTEMGALGQWDAPLTPWRAPVELTSTQKAERMRPYLLAAQRDHIGAFPFLWGQKQEVTPTWHALFLPTGEWTEPVEVMAQTWGGSVPGGPNRAPRILSFAIDGTMRMAPGEERRVNLLASDPDGDPLKVEWVVMREQTVRSVGGDPEPLPESFPNAVKAPSPTGARISSLPVGHYRIFAYVRDGKGAAATANLPFEVR